MNTFSRNFPLTRPHCGIPMANGQMGILVWGNDKICLTINRADYWDHRYGEKYLGPDYKKLLALYDPYDVEPMNQAFVRMEKPFDGPEFFWRSTRLPAGRFELTFDHEIKPRKAVLDYETGTVTIVCNNNKNIYLHQDFKQDVLLVEDKEKLIDKVSFASAWEYVGDKFAKAGLEKPEKVDIPTLCGEIQPLPEDPSMAVLCSKGATIYAVTIQRGKDNPSAFSKAQKALKNKDSEDIKTGCRAFWNNYWQRIPEINIPDGFLNDFYKFALYKFACATHPNGMACGLQGPWVEEYQRTPWAGDYHFNVNIQQIYTVAFATGNFEHLIPLFDMLETAEFKKTMRENARNMFGIDDGLLMTHAVDDQGRQCGGIMAGASLDFACSGWTAQLYWLYYKYTLDTNFLKERALPFIRDVMRVFEETLAERNGQLYMPLAISAEYGCSFKVKKDGRYVKQNTGRNPSYQLACTHMLADFLIEASKILGEKPKPIWLDIKKRLPHYTLSENTEKPQIAIWEGQDLDVCHRHHSHLACIYPFDTLPNPTGEQQNIIDNSIEHWILRGMGQWSEWCYPWAAIIQARMGFKEAPAMLLDIWRKVFINEGYATAYLPQFEGLSAHRRADMKKPRKTNEIMQLDGTMGGATAILEMLVHQKGDTVYLFNAIPDEWSDVSFKNIYLPNAFTISSQRKNGHISSISVKSLHGGLLKLVVEGTMKEFHFTPGEEKKISPNLVS